MRSWTAVFSLLLSHAAVLGQGPGGCPERNGRFPVSTQCDAYIECVDGVPEQKLCPDGLLFNAKSAFFAYPCQYPPEVDCEGRSQRQAPQPTEVCPHQFGYYKVGDAENCGQFMICASGVGYTFDCPDGLAFNEYSLRCDWPDQVETCNAEAYLGFSCPSNDPNSIFAAEGYRYFRSPSDCQTYFLCIKSRPRRFRCGEGYAFNDLTSSCDGIENVTGCAFPAKRETGQQRLQLFVERNHLT
ncbi:protein obstructor-E-like [Homalodisca vitripennis]|uniref:protein obstructor-E-like n=1 Tax=Homalodisca vitripennis TaxID=197043 RepID=UPI001EEB5A7B|nr:protein obstructor-E-like [Homalodisca vitripennis]